jgi:predicted GNAT superfamily acetyltransferase
MLDSAFHVRHCTALDDFEQCVELQRATWRESIIVPSALFVVALETGGQVIAAFAGTEMVGFLMALVGIHGTGIGEVFLHSHMTAVLPAWQNRGVGRALKLAQRDDALGRGIHMIEWTFDPLELRNGHFNLRRLGAISRRYIPNLYGITDSPLHAGLPTDRLLAEWHLDSSRVLRALAPETRLPKDAALSSAAAVRISIPLDIAELRASDRPAALREQSRIRAEFQHWFDLGYTAVDFARDADGACYILTPPSEVQP